MPDVRYSVSRSFSGALVSACSASLLTVWLSDKALTSAADGGYSFLFTPPFILYQLVLLAIISAVVSMVFESDPAAGQPISASTTKWERWVAEFGRELGLLAAVAFLLLLVILFVRPKTDAIARLLLPCLVIGWVAVVWGRTAYQRLAPLEIPVEKTRKSDDWVWPIVLRFRRRAVAHRLAAAGSQFLILIAFTGGVALFVFADEVFYAQVSRDQVRTDKARLQLAGQLADIRQQITGRGTANSDDWKTVRTKLENYETELDTQKDPHSAMISSIATRIGAICLIYFLVQLFVTVYRFNIRHAAYYDARADALQIWEALEHPDLEDFVEIFSPDELDFGKMPGGPLAKIAQTLKDISGTVTKAASESVPGKAVL